MGDGYLSLENQVALIDSIVKSTDKLIPIIEHTKEFDETINHTIMQIFGFLSRVIVLLPDVLLSETENYCYKAGLIEAHERVIETWKEFRYEPQDFFDSWEEFSNYWAEYNEVLNKIRNSSSTIFLSMN